MMEGRLPPAKTLGQFSLTLRQRPVVEVEVCLANSVDTALAECLEGWKRVPCKRGPQQSYGTVFPPKGPGTQV